MQEHANKLETNAQSVAQDFSIGESSVIIDILRNRLYEHKIRTSIQEIVCNAKDAMREVGKGNEFEITIPTRLSPVFKVRDFGPSISPERMENVFIRYGSSTKRNDNNQIGGFGIGGKSFFSYTDSFTITTWFDGMRRVYIAHIGVNNQGRLDLVSSDVTSEPTGTEIQVAVKHCDIEEFKLGVFRAIYFWTDRPIIKGELQVPERIKGHVISDLVEVLDLGLVPHGIVDTYSAEAVALIDGVVYPLNSNMVNKIESIRKVNNLLKGTLVLHFGNGLVEVSASRESIADSKHTVAALEKLGSKALLEVNTHIATEFSKVKDTTSYIKTYAVMSKSFEVDDHAKFGDYEIKSSWIKSPAIRKVRITTVSNLDRRGHKCSKVTKNELREGSREISINQLGHLFFVTKDESKVVQNKRIRAFLQANVTTMVLVELLTGMELDPTAPPTKNAQGVDVPATKKVIYDAEFKKVIADLDVKDFHAIAYVDPPKVVKAKVKREDAEICMHVFGGGRHKYTTLATNDRKRFYVPLVKGEWPNTFNRETLEQLNNFLSTTEGALVCGLAERAVKMVQGDTNFIPLADWLAKFKPTKDVINSVKRLEVSRNNDSIRLLNRMKDIKDKFLIEMVDEYKTFCNGKATTLPKILEKQVTELKEIKDFNAKDESFAKHLKSQYPLLEEIGTSARYPDELTIYVNAKYTAKKRNK
jgi:hypothetical protein